MGWVVRLGLAAGLGAVAYRSLTRVNRLVRQVRVPSQSLLGKHSQAATHYISCIPSRGPVRGACPPGIT